MERSRTSDTINDKLWGRLKEDVRDFFTITSTVVRWTTRLRTIVSDMNGFHRLQVKYS